MISINLRKCIARQYIQYKSNYKYISSLYILVLMLKQRRKWFLGNIFWFQLGKVILLVWTIWFHNKYMRSYNFQHSQSLNRGQRWISLMQIVLFQLKPLLKSLFQNALCFSSPTAHRAKGLLHLDFPSFCQSSILS